MDEPVSLVLLLLLCCCFGNGLVTDKSVIEITFTDAEGARQTSEMIGTFSRFGVVANVEGKLFHMGEDCDRKLPSDEQLILVMTQTCEAVIATVINVRAVIIDYHSDQLEERLGSLHISLPIVLLHKRFNEISTSSDAYVVVKSSSMVFPTKHKEREYFDIGIFMAFFIMVSLICMVVLIKIKWRQRRKKISRKKCAQKLLQTMEVREYTGEEKPFSIKNCAVCLEELRIGNDVRVLPCQHEFHVACVDPWLLENYTCPLCCYRILDLKADTKKSRCLLNCFRNRNRYSSDDVEDPVLHCEQDVTHCEIAVMHCERVNSPLIHSERENRPLMHSERGATKKPVSQKDERTQYNKTFTRLSHNVQKHETCVSIDNKIEKPVSTKIMHVCKSRTPAKQNSCQIISSSVIHTKPTQNNNAK